MGSIELELNCTSDDGNACAVAGENTNSVWSEDEDADAVDAMNEEAGKVLSTMKMLMHIFRRR